MSPLAPSDPLVILCRSPSHGGRVLSRTRRTLAALVLVVLGSGTALADSARAVDPPGQRMGPNKAEQDAKAENRAERWARCWAGWQGDQKRRWDVEAFWNWVEVNWTERRAEDCP